MILWSLKLVSTVRKAIAGRRYPAQLAWAVAFGLLLGLIPHGNLVTVLLLLLVLSLKLNHAMAGLVTIGVTFVATYLDPWSHRVGSFAFSIPAARETMTRAWDLPLVPWTDLNNTVVAGSFLIGLAALVPMFLLTYPIFKFWSLGLAVTEESGITASTDRGPSRDRVRPITTIEPAHGAIAAPHVRLTNPPPTNSVKVDTNSPLDVRRVDEGKPLPAPPHEAIPAKTSSMTTPVQSSVREPKLASGEAKPATLVAVQPRNAGVREAVSKPSASVVVGVGTRPASSTDDQQKIDEALRYLLRQLRDSQEKGAA